MREPWAFWAGLEPSWVDLGPSWADLGPSWADLGLILGLVGAIFGTLRVIFRSSSTDLGPSGTAYLSTRPGGMREAVQ